jgi:hypothetical protein
VDAGANTVSIGTNSASNISPLNIQADEAGARAIRIVGRTDDYSELDFYENDNSTILARLQAHSSVLNIRSYGGADTDFRVESDSNANALFVQASDGKVGIGTSSPETNNAASVGLTVGSGGGGAAIQLNVNGGGGIFSGTDTINNPNYSYRMGHLNGTNRLEMSTNNNDSYANGVVLSAGGTSWGTFSDERRKTDLVEITDGLNKVSTLRAVTGRYNYDDANVRRSMLIAQDVQAA